MKKRLFVLLIFMMLILAACGKNNSDSASESDATPSSASESDSISGENEVSGELSEEASLNIWEIYNEDGIHVDLLSVLNYNDGMVCYPIRVYSDVEKDFSLRLSKVVLNDHIAGDDISAMYLPGLGSIEAGEYLYGYSEEWSNSLIKNGEDKLRSISAVVSIYVEDMKLEKETDISFVIPDDYQVELSTVKYRGARVEKQTIYEDDQFRVDLLTMGYLPVSNTISSSMSFVIKCYNNSDKKYLFDIGGIMVNGVYMEASLGSVSIAPDMESILDFTLYDYDFEKYGIDKIGDVAFLLEVRNELHQFSSGDILLEEWCPVELIEKEKVENTFNTGDIVFEQDGITLGLIGKSDNSDLDDSKYSSYYWDFALINDTDEGIRIQTYDEYINGVKASDFGDVIISLYDEIGPNSKRYIRMAYMGESGEDRPKVKCKFMITNMDDSKLFFTTDDDYDFD